MGGLPGSRIENDRLEAYPTTKIGHPLNDWPLVHSVFGTNGTNFLDRFIRNNQSSIILSLSSALEIAWRIG